jgi:hypothetical protein
MPEDVISGRHMKIKIRQCHVQQVLLPDQVHRVIAQLQSDRALFRTIDLFGLEGFQILERLVNTRCQFGKRFLVAFILGRLEPR